MQILGLSLLCLTLALLSHTGTGQALANLRCSQCKGIIQKDKDSWLAYAVNISIQRQEECHGSTIMFTGKIGDTVAVMCANNNLQWVTDIIKCLKQGERKSDKLKDCPDCKLIVPNDEDKWQRIADRLSVQSHDKCSDSIIRFKLLNNGAVLCGHNAHQWVQNVIKSLAKDPNPEFYRGASENPSTANLNPTTIPVTMVMTPTATAQNPNMATSREATEMTRPSKPSVANNGTHNGRQENVTNLLPSTSNKGALTTPHTTLNPTTTPKVTVLMTTTTAKNPDIITPREIITTTTPSNGSLGKLGGVKSSNGPLTENKSEINQMKTTIISLVFIVLVMVAAGTGIFCYKKKLPCLEKPIQYTQAPSQDTLEMGTTTT